jgi:16S rRNA (uracil1498-N3)-methyltransferase
MRIPRIYHDGVIRPGIRLDLAAPSSNHLLRVLRLVPGARVEVFDGAGHSYEAVIEDHERGRARLLVGDPKISEVESPIDITLAQGISRGERMDYTLQKSVELGVRRIVPLVTDFCQVRLAGPRQARRHEHWMGIIIGACEQCGRNRLPILDEIRPLPKWLGEMELGRRGCAKESRATDERSTDTLKLVLDAKGERRLSDLDPPGRVTLLIGPEGGLAEKEVAAARAAGFIAVRLGPRILRTESAGVAALAAIQTLWGDLA